MSKRKTPDNQINQKYKLVSKPSITGITLLVMFIIGLLSAVGSDTADVILKLNYESAVGHHIQEAFNTVSAPASSKQLGIALSVIESNHLNTGYTNWIWKSKCGDRAFWYNTLKEAKADVDRASYERAWSPEADENVILARHYKVLTDTYGESLSPCAIHQGEYKPVFDVVNLFELLIIPGFIGSAIRGAFRNFDDGIIYTKLTKDGKAKMTMDLDHSDKSNYTAGWFKTWKAVKVENSDEVTVE